MWAGEGLGVDVAGLLLVGVGEGRLLGIWVSVGSGVKVGDDMKVGVGVLVDVA